MNPFLGPDGPLPRTLPAVTALTEGFWRGGADGELRMLRCSACRTWSHPPRPQCAVCGALDMRSEATIGRGTVFTFAINHQAWRPWLPVPYVVAVVELDDQPGLRLTTNVVGCPPAEVAIGQRVGVVFEPHGDIWVPLFAPTDPSTDNEPSSR